MAYNPFLPWLDDGDYPPPDPDPSVGPPASLAGDSTGFTGPPASAAGHSYGFMMPSTFNGQPIDPAAAQRAKGNAFLAFGSHLMGLQAARDPGAALGAGVQEATATYHQALQEAAAQRRQQLLDEQNRQRAQLEMKGQQQEQAIRGSQEDRTSTLFDESEQDKADKTDAMQGLHDQIQSMAPGSPEAARAEALMRGGDQLFPDMLKLHDEVLARDPARAEQTGKLQAITDAAAVKGEVAAGVREDPLAAGRRADSELVIKRSQLGIEQQREGDYHIQVTKQTDRGFTLDQFNDNVAKESQRLYRQWEDGKMAGSGKMRIDPATGKITTYGGPSDAERQAARQAAESQAVQSISARANAFGLSGLGRPSHLPNAAPQSPGGPPGGPSAAAAGPPAPVTAPPGFRPGVPTYNPATHKLETYDASGRIISSV